MDKRRVNIVIHSKIKNIVSLFATIYSDPTLAAAFSRVTVESRRELRTGSTPMESCRPAIIVSFGVAAHWRRKTAFSAAGIDSVAEFRGVTK